VSGRWELRQGDAVVRASAPTRIRAEADGRVARLVGVSLADLEAGDYSLVLAVRDEVAGADTTVEEAFSVVP
jgi:5-hydroxyisourate hydrolase-like protein (transthyretin family)